MKNFKLGRGYTEETNPSEPMELDVAINGLREMFERIREVNPNFNGQIRVEDNGEIFVDNQRML
jgi:hypothetical protein